MRRLPIYRPEPDTGWHLFTARRPPPRQLVLWQTEDEQVFVGCYVRETTRTSFRYSWFTQWEGGSPHPTPLDCHPIAWMELPTLYAQGHAEARRHD